MNINLNLNPFQVTNKHENSLIAAKFSNDLPDNIKWHINNGLEPRHDIKNSTEYYDSQSHAYRYGYSLGSKNMSFNKIKFDRKGLIYERLFLEGYHRAQTKLPSEKRVLNFQKLLNKKRKEIKIDERADYHQFPLPESLKNRDSYQLGLELGLKSIPRNNDYLKDKGWTFQGEFNRGYEDGQRQVQKQQRQIVTTNKFSRSQNKKRSREGETENISLKKRKVDLLTSTPSTSDPAIMADLKLNSYSGNFSAKDLIWTRFSVSKNKVVFNCLIPIPVSENDHDASQAIRLIHAYKSGNTQAIMLISTARKAISSGDDKKLNEVVEYFKTTNWQFIEMENEMDINAFEIKPECGAVLIPLQKLRTNPDAPIKFSLVMKDNVWHYLSVFN